MALISSLVSTPGALPTYNTGMAETFSWIPIEGAGRPLFAKATYNVNTQGQSGFVFTSNTNQVSGSFTSIQVISAAKFSVLDATNSTVGSLSGFELPQGFTLTAPITAYKLQYGAVIAYKG